LHFFPIGSVFLQTVETLSDSGFELASVQCFP
jgi:hypothetical protein